MSVEHGLNDDFRDILRALAEARAEYLVVGAHAMALHGVPRATGDLDVFVRPSADNARRVLSALRSFGAPVDDHGVTAADLEVAGTVYQIGMPPRRIDLMTAIDGVEFGAAWDSREEVPIAGLIVPFLGRSALLANKRASGRDKDLVDLRLLGDTGETDTAR
jgi:hypothetical protein